MLSDGHRTVHQFPFDTSQQHNFFVPHKINYVLFKINCVPHKINYVLFQINSTKPKESLIDEYGTNVAQVTKQED